MAKQQQHPVPPDGKEWYSLGQAAALFGIEPQTLGYHIKHGHLVAAKLGDGEKSVWMIHISALLDFAAKRKKAGRPPKPKKPPEESKPSGGNS